MRLSIEKKDIQPYIQHLSTVVGSKNTSPIMLNYLIDVDAESNNVTIKASDLELHVIVTFKATVIESGTVAVSARHFNEIIAAMPEGLIEFWKNEELLMIQGNKIDFKILSADPSLYPILTEPEAHQINTINAELFMRMVRKTSFAVSLDVQRAILTGVCWKIYRDRHLMAATDGRKVSEITIKAIESSDLEMKSATVEPGADSEDYVEKVIPVKTLNFLQLIYNSNIKDLGISFSDSQIVFFYGNFVIISNVFDAKYPDYSKAFMVELPNRLEVKVKDLLETLRRVSLVAPDDVFRVKFEIDNTQFEVSSYDRETGDAKEFVQNYVYTGEPTSISFNFKYMVSILEALDTEKVVIRLGTAREPMIVTNESDPPNQQIIHLLMPLRS
ncbi:MAG TPA: DNA polymerase III subunit beta [Candidatus Cloacimonetes bacterium]|jgi:DNA polymerase-3 subunit beta|nr:DNA polymerase III subunit beta [Candidatus Cloacimonadota bacterium]